jgi:four helix bundle protein
MIATSLDDLHVFQDALAAAGAVSAILDRPTLRNDRELRKQLADCSSRIPALISEGFGQKTDRHCAHYQYLARGSSNEMCAHLVVTCARKHISVDERDKLSRQYTVIGKKLTRWIQHLEREDRPRRG